MTGFQLAVSSIQSHDVSGPIEMFNVEARSLTEFEQGHFHPMFIQARSKCVATANVDDVPLGAVVTASHPEILSGIGTPEKATYDLTVSLYKNLPNTEAGLLFRVQHRVGDTTKVTHWRTRVRTHRLN